MPRIAEKMPSPLKCLYRGLQKLGLSHWGIGPMIVFLFTLAGGCSLPEKYHPRLIGFRSKDDFAPSCPSAKFPLVSPTLRIMSSFLVVAAAKNLVAMNPHNAAVFDVKRLIGQARTFLYHPYLEHCKFLKAAEILLIEDHLGK
ncbi:hsp70-like protein [Colletotrichum acutatum]